MHLQQLLDNPRVRIAVGTIFVAPITLAVMIALPYELITGVVGVKEGDVFMMSFIVLALLGVLGVCGLWIRLLVPSATMSRREQLAVRICVSAGAVGSAWAGAAFLVNSEVLSGSGLLAIACLGALFFAATPYAQESS